MVIFAWWVFFPKNLALSHTTIYGPLAPCEVSEKTNVPILRKLTDRQKDGWKDGQTLFYRTLMAEAKGPTRSRIPSCMWVEYCDRWCQWKAWVKGCILFTFFCSIWLKSPRSNIVVTFTVDRTFSITFPKTLKYWVGIQQGQSYLMGRMCLFGLPWPPS